MSAAVLASGISAHPSTEGRHVVLALHDAEGMPLAMVLLSPTEAMVVSERMASALRVVTVGDLRPFASTVVN